MAAARLLDTVGVSVAICASFACACGNHDAAPSGRLEFGDAGYVDSAPAPSRVVDATVPAKACNLSVPPDALPPIADAAPAFTDASPVVGRSVPSRACADGGAPLAYLVDAKGALYTFDPATLVTTRLGVPCCADVAGAWDITISSSGNIYILFSDWKLFELDLGTLACTETSYKNNQLGQTHGFSFMATTVVPTVQGDQMLYFGTESTGGTMLARSNLSSFELDPIGVVTPMPMTTLFDVKGDGLGHLYGLGSSGEFIEIDMNSAQLLQDVSPGYVLTSSWSLLTYHGNVYFFFGATASSSTVSQYDVTSQVVTSLGTVPLVVAGASAVPCLDSATDGGGP